MRSLRRPWKLHPRRPRGSQSGREKRRVETYLKTFVPPFLPTRLTAPESPRTWKLGLRIVVWSKPRIFSEESLGKIKFRAFPKRVGPRIISLESVDYFGTSKHYRTLLSGDRKKKTEFCCKSVLFVKMLVPFRYFFYFPFLTEEISGCGFRCFLGVVPAK